MNEKASNITEAEGVDLFKQLLESLNGLVKVTAQHAEAMSRVESSIDRLADILERDMDQDEGEQPREPQYL